MADWFSEQFTRELEAAIYYDYHPERIPRDVWDYAADVVCRSRMVL